MTTDNTNHVPMATPAPCMKDTMKLTQSIIMPTMPLLKTVLMVQGDHSCCVKPPVDIKIKVPFCFEVNGSLVTT